MNKKQIDPSYGYSNLQIPQYKLYDYKVERNDMYKELDESLAEDIIKLEKELELYKKALELSCKDKAFIDIDQHSTQDFIDMYLSHAREELENGE